jgi:hypothetical protein
MRTVDVSTFATKAGQLNKVPIVDAMVSYDCKRTNQVYLLVARNVLYVESMEINLIPPFILREKGLEVREVPKTQCKEPTVDDHTIQETESGLFIPLSLDGTFSTFDTRKPTDVDIVNGTIVVITPEGSSWNPYCDSYADNEDSMTNAVGDLLPSEYIHREIISDEDHPCIDTVLGVESIDRYDDVAIISAMREMEEKSPPLDCFDAAIRAASKDAVTLNGIDKEYVYDAYSTRSSRRVTNFNQCSP